MHIIKIYRFKEVYSKKMPLSILKINFIYCLAVEDIFTIIKIKIHTAIEI